MLEARGIENAVAALERHQVQRREIARRVVEEHVLGAWIGSADRSRLRARVPIVDRGVKLDAGIGRCPGGVADLFPQISCLQRLRHLIAVAIGQLPILVLDDRIEELVGDAHRVVRILARYGEVGFAVPVGIVGREVDFLVALTCELDDATNVVVRHMVASRFLDGSLQLRVLGRVEAALVENAVRAGAALGVAVDARLHDRLQALRRDLGAGDESGDLLLLLHLPVDVLFDIGMIDVDHHHLGGAACGAAALDGACSPVTDLEEAHQAARPAAARKALVGAAQRGEVGARARAVLEEACLADPQVHDAVLVDEIVLHRLDEAGVRLRVLVGGRRCRQRARLVIDIEVALARAVDAIGPVQAGVEPLRAVRSSHLHGKHVAVLVEEGSGRPLPL